MYMYYTIYQTTNLINSKTYIGAHKTNNLEDGYIGSGKYLNHSINKYSIENFKKEILAVLETAEDMYEVESLLVNEEFVSRKDTYNLKEGGFGGFDYINKHNLGSSKNWTKESREAQSRSSLKSAKKHMENGTGIFGISTEQMLVNLSKANLIKQEKYPNGTFQGKTHTEETKQKMRESSKGKHVGKKNSQYSTCWIYSLEKETNKKISKDDLEVYLQNGWIKGRKMKF